MASIEYKILFEVRFLHDYYLYGSEPGVTDKEQKSFFAMSVEGQAIRLSELLGSGQYDIRKDLSFIVSPNDEKIFKKLRMKLVRTATGFFLGIQVKRVVSGNGEIRFQPFIALSENVQLTIGLSAVNPSFAAFSNLRLDRDTDNIYYFSNEGVHHGFSLASPIRPVVVGQQYRMGDLALVAGNVRQAIADNTGNTRFWKAIAGQGFIHQGDRSLSSQNDWYNNWKSSIGLMAKDPLGVIKIVLTSENKKLSLINDDNLLTTRLRSTIKNIAHPVFELNWLSRSTYWRYRKRNKFSEKERTSIMNSMGLFLSEEIDQFVTKEPWPIIRERLIRRSPGTDFQFPCAQIGMIKKESGKLFSDIEFNDLNPLPKDS